MSRDLRSNGAGGTIGESALPFRRQWLGFAMLNETTGACDFPGLTGPSSLNTAAEGIPPLTVQMLCPADGSSLAGTPAFRHRRAEPLDEHPRANSNHIMHQAGRMRISLRNDNTMDDVELSLTELASNLY